LAAFGGLVGFFIQGVVKSGSGVGLLGLQHSLFILLGLASMLHVLVVHTREQGVWGTLQRAFLGAVALLGTFFMLAHLPGAGVSLFWALASVLTFVIGHLLATRSLRMVGLVGLVIATIRVLSHDITDMLGRIAACAAVAVAFFGVAWLYGRITADKKDA
jgi:drug/metabolite transporter (DMT)-like permease